MLTLNGEDGQLCDSDRFNLRQGCPLWAPQTFLMLWRQEITFRCRESNHNSSETRPAFQSQYYDTMTPMLDRMRLVTLTSVWKINKYETKETICEPLHSLYVSRAQTKHKANCELYVPSALTLKNCIFQTQYIHTHTHTHTHTHVCIYIVYFSWETAIISKYTL
jgi:hypothetical protein